MKVLKKFVIEGKAGAIAKNMPFMRTKADIRIKIDWISKKNKFPVLLLFS